jgi:hypothetical protein
MRFINVMFAGTAARIIAGVFELLRNVKVDFNDLLKICMRDH